MILFGYLDAGTGSVVIQAVIAIFVGASVFLKVYWQKLISIFGGKKKEESKDLRK